MKSVKYKYSIWVDEGTICPKCDSLILQEFIFTGSKIDHYTCQDSECDFFEDFTINECRLFQKMIRTEDEYMHKIIEGDPSQPEPSGIINLKPGKGGTMLDLDSEQKEVDYLVDNLEDDADVKQKMAEQSEEDHKANDILIDRET